MTTLMAPPREQTSRPAPVTFRRWVRRTHKILIPLILAFVIVVITFVAHGVQSVNVTNSEYLNPDSSAPLGGLTLATKLRAKGINVDRQITMSDAIQAAQDERGPVTLFLPSLELTDPYYANSLEDLPHGTRIVVVAPGERGIFNSDLPVDATSVRWAPRTVDPGCDLPAAQAAGRAAVDGVEYMPDGSQATICYGGGLVDLQDNPDVDITIVGASDPFRNDRIGEAGNATLAVGLLDVNPNVIWLDTHDYPKVVQPTLPPASKGSSGGGSTLADLFPPWLWAGIGMLALAGLAFAFAAARRLGPPVSEPLPVAARINETIEGRGRLYGRTKDRSAALKILQAAAIERVRIAGGLPPGAAPNDIIAAVATYLNIGADEVAHILYGAAPADDNELMYAVACLDAITDYADPQAARSAPLDTGEYS